MSHRGPFGSRIPVIFCIDVEPDPRLVNRFAPEPWAGYEFCQRYFGRYLMPVIPSPSHGHAALQYTLAVRGPVDLAIYSVDGRKLRTLTHGVQDVGSYRLMWDGADDRGSRVGSGVYFVRLEASGVQKSRVISLVR